MEPEKYRSDLMLVATAMQAVGNIDIPKMLQAIEHCDTVAPFVDPTLYMQNRDKMMEDKELLEAALPLWKLHAKWKEKYGENEKT